ncbi:MAG TPA: type I-U CRISPR-associated protein Csb2 [Terriglobales bacterium]|jgi:CRISPR-associated protein Csb2|nr:type I-U CRISPR-associated protein Csb2 [Terriglobales bacterium]
MLALEIELLTGVYRATLPDCSAAEWPPHPERVFSALAQSWGDGGCDVQERAALEWLERLPAPLIEADPPENCSERSSPTVFVPPNDARGGDIAVLPERRPRQARDFKVQVPTNPLIRLVWPEAQGQTEHLAALEALASRVASLGHSASLVRFTFGNEATPDNAKLWRPDDGGSAALRTMHQGRLRNLETWLAGDERPKVGMSVRYRRPLLEVQTEGPKSVFGAAADWFVFEDEGGSRPDLLAFAHIAKCVRMSLMTCGPQPPPEVVSGHTADGTATSRPHIAIVPLANVGWEHATGDLLGFAVVLPRGMADSERLDVLRALAAFARLEEGEGMCAELHLSATVHWRVQRAAVPSRASLRPERWCKTAVSWASAMPVLLDRFPEHNDPVEEARLIAAACRNIGLPEPIEIEIHKHSAVRGGPSAYRAGGNRSPGPDWSFPKGAKFARRPRRHVVLRFGEPVTGPVLLGAGRFHGFGMCLPLDWERLP